MLSNAALLFVAVLAFDQTNFIFADCVHGNLYSHSINCRLFYKCVHGKLIEFQCPHGLYFNHWKDYCDWPRNVDCDRKTTATTPTGSTTTTELTPSTPAVPQACEWTPGQQIAMGNRCEVPGGLFVFQFDGNAVIYDRKNVSLWSTQTAGTGHRFEFQSDGNLVMYSASGVALWNSQTHDQGATLLLFQQDRNLVIYKPEWVALWNSGTHVVPNPTEPSTTTVRSTTTMQSPPTTPSFPEACQWTRGEEIIMGQRCEVPDGLFTFQFDGNAVIYDIDNIALWNTETAGIGHRFVFQSDGNLVMYSAEGVALWNSRTYDQGGTLLIFQPDRNLVIYEEEWVALWNSGTYVAPSPTTTTTTKSTTTSSPPSTPSSPEICQWTPGQEIIMGTRCDVPSGFFKFQQDGNVVIYDSSNVALWYTATTDIGNTLVFQSDGNLVVYSSSGSAVWDSGTQNQGSSLLIFQPDRNLVIYNSDGVALWNTGTTSSNVIA